MGGMVLTACVFFLFSFTCPSSVIWKQIFYLGTKETVTLIFVIIYVYGWHGKGTDLASNSLLGPGT